MSVACKYIANGVTVYPDLPIEVTEEARGNGIDLLNGKKRFYYRTTLHTWPLRLTGATEAERTSWRSAFPLNTSYTLTDETGTSYTVRTVSRNIPLAATSPAIEGGTNTTGAGTYNIEVMVEELG